MTDATVRIGCEHGPTRDGHPLARAEKQIFDAHDRRAAKGQRVVADGAVCPACWSAPESARVVFVLKEVNHDGSAGLDDLREFLRTAEGLGPKGRMGATWNTVARWMELFEAERAGHPAPAVDALEQIRVTPAAVRSGRLPALNRLCVVNLNKGGGGATANAVRLTLAASRDATLLSAQLALYRDARLYVCGGGDVAEIVAGLDLLGPLLPLSAWREVGVSIGKRKARARWTTTAWGVPVIAAPHPAARKSTRELRDLMVACLAAIEPALGPSAGAPRGDHRR